MRIEGNTIYADEGKTLRRKADKLMRGETLTLGYTCYIGGERLNEPRLEIPDDYEEVSEDDLQKEKEALYPSLVEQYIREIYSLSAELAIQRQRDEKPEDFQNYFNYCEDCKRRAKTELGL
jgi:hypothetical protein